MAEQIPGERNLPYELVLDDTKNGEPVYIPIGEGGKPIMYISYPALLADVHKKRHFAKDKLQYPQYDCRMSVSYDLYLNSPGYISNMSICYADL